MSNKVKSTTPVLPKLNFNDPEETVTLDLGQGNWIEVTGAATAKSNATYLEVVSGIKYLNTEQFTKGIDVEFSAWENDTATVKSRVVNWNIGLIKRDGSSREIPFSVDAVDSLPNSIITHVAAEIRRLDSEFAASVTGTDDPNV